MEVIFLGTGGGRINLIKQFRSTGGQWIMSNDLNILVDPGPGSLLQAKKYGLDPLKLDAIIVTHYHVDHCSDSDVMIEAMTNYALNKKGIFIGSEYTIEGDKNGDTGVTKYHLSKVEKVVVAKYGAKEKFEKFGIEFLELRHDEPTAFGFKLYIDGKVLGLICDTEYFEELGELYKDCDLLLVSCLKPKKDNIPDHLKTDDVIRILQKAKPKKTVIYHLGMKMLKAGPEKEAEKIEQKSNVKCEAATDGMRVVV